MGSSGADWIPAAFWAVFVGSALAWPLSAWVLARYRAAVEREMRAGGAGHDAVSGATAGPRPRLRIEDVDAGGRPPSALFGQARRRRRAAMLGSVAGALAYAAVGSALAHSFDPDLFNSWPRLLVTFLVFAWPVLPELWRQAGMGPKEIGAVLLGWVVVVAGLGGPDALSYLAYWAIQGLAPGVWFLLLAGGRRRAVAPWVFLPLATGLLGFAGAVQIASTLLERTSGWTDASVVGLVWTLAVVALAGVGLGALVLPIVSRLFRRRWVSDVDLAGETWWLAFTLWTALFWTFSSGVVIAWVLPLGARWLVRGVVRRALRGPKTDGAGVVLLRVFGHQERTERFFQLLADTWRFAGPVRMIGGTDLAQVTLEPHELLDHLTGTMHHHFVTSDDELAAGLGALDDRAFPDGRYPIQELFCDGAHWKPAVMGLLDRSGAVLMDLRRFDGTPGCTWELYTLVNVVPTERLVLLVGDETELVRQRLEEAWAAMAEDSPNRGGEERLIQLIRVRGSRADARGTVQRLAAAVELPG